MKALVYTADKEMTYRDEPPPRPAPGDALVAIDSVGICGSDMHAYLGHDPRRVPPLILGHEAVGTVIEGSRPGQAVLLNPLITCGKCTECLSGRQNLCAQRDLIGMLRPGAFAEQIRAPGNQPDPAARRHEPRQSRADRAPAQPRCTRSGWRKNPWHGPSAKPAHWCSAPARSAC